MVGQSLVDYIRNGLRDGISIDFLIQQSLNQGWTEQEIKEAANIATGRPVSTAPHASEPPTPGVHTTRLPRQTPSTPQARPAEQVRQAQPAKSQITQEKKPRPKRPTGITILALLGIVLSVISLAGGILLLTAGGLLSLLVGSDTGLTALGLLGSLSMLIGIVNLAVGIFGFIAYFLLFKMRKSGFIMVILIAVISLGPSLMNFDIISIILTGLILVYLIANRKLFV